MSTTSADTSEPNPFAGIEDEVARTPHEAIADTLDAAKRGWFPLRRTFVQRVRNSEPQDARPNERASVLYDFVNGRHQRPLDLFLLLHAYQPVLGGTPLKLSTWARMLSFRSQCSVTGVSRAIETLERLNLAQRIDGSHSPELRLKKEDGTDAEWVRAGSDENEEGPGYFIVPHQYWTDSIFTKLTLPGQAMFLISLENTQNPQTPAYAMAHEWAKDRYGISERTAERGYSELRKAGILRTHVQKVADRKHPAGRREVTWRALQGPFSTSARQQAQAATVTIAKAAEAKARANKPVKKVASSTAAKKAKRA